MVLVNKHYYYYISVTSKSHACTLYIINYLTTNKNFNLDRVWILNLVEKGYYIVIFTVLFITTPSVTLMNCYSLYYKVTYTTVLGQVYEVVQE